MHHIHPFLSFFLFTTQSLVFGTRWNKSPLYFFIFFFIFSSVWWCCNTTKLLSFFQYFSNFLFIFSSVWWCCIATKFLSFLFKFSSVWWCRITTEFLSFFQIFYSYFHPFGGVISPQKSFLFYPNSSFHKIQIHSTLFGCRHRIGTCIFWMNPVLCLSYATIFVPFTIILYLYKGKFFKWLFACIYMHTVVFPIRDTHISTNIYIILLIYS